MNARQSAIRKEQLELISQWSTSGLTPMEFCEKHNLANHQFYYWLKKIKQKNQSTVPDARSNFIPVHISKSKEQTETAPLLELIFPNGKRIKFYSSVNFSELRSLVIYLVVSEWFLSITYLRVPSLPPASALVAFPLSPAMGLI